MKRERVFRRSAMGHADLYGDIRETVRARLASPGAQNKKQH